MSSSKVAIRTGSCLCGSVRVRISAEPAQNVLCHCLSCKKSGGGVFMANFFCAKDVEFPFSPPSPPVFPLLSYRLCGYVYTKCSRLKDI